MTNQFPASSERAAMPVLRFALIGGAAGIAATHIQALHQIPQQAAIVGLCDVNAERGAARAAELGCPFFVDHHELLQQVAPDVAVICAPHPFHASLALDCFAAGVHVLVEKPIAVQVAEADAMIAAADAANRLLAVSFQQRFRPVVERAKQLVDAGVVGPLVRVLCVEPWFRTAAYYRSATWRGSWRGEGGGVLLNQAPHTLDLLCYLAGVPSTLWGWTRTRYHAIECEDTAQAMLEYPNGAPGYLTASTVEAGSQQRIHIVGENGALELSGSTLTVTRFAPSIPDHMRGSDQPFAAPPTSTETLELPGDNGGHLAVYRDLYAAITEERQPRSNGREARMSLELANAITLSSYAERAVRLPIDRDEYAALLEELKAGRR